MKNMLPNTAWEYVFLKSYLKNIAPKNCGNMIYCRS